MKEPRKETDSRKVTGLFLNFFFVVVVENSGNAISLHFGELVAPKIS